MRKTFIIALTGWLALAGGWHSTPEALAGEHATPLTRAHSHNDYYRERPLLDALELGIISVEADIFNIDGQLLVAHDRHRVDPEETLEGMYLDPLLERARARGGRIYAEGPPLILLIDIKDDAEQTYRRLREVLADYAEMLTHFYEDRVEERAVTVILSGNRPIDMVKAETPPRLAALDGRRPQLEPGTSRYLYPMVSMAWLSVFDWTGQDEMPAGERALLDELVAAAHANGQMIRFWGTPIWPAVWETLYDAKVDLINADHIQRLHDFLHERKAETRAGE